MPDRRRRPSRAPQPNSLVAAAHIITSPNSSLSRSSVGSTQGWQNDAWDFYDLIGELRFGISWIANAMSRVNLVAAARPASSGDTPRPLDLDDPDITPAQRRAVEIVSTIADGPAGQGQLLNSFGIHLSVAGIAWLVIEPPLDDELSDSFALWTVLSSDEIRDGQYGLEIRVTDRTWRPIHPNAVVIRVWRRHPRHQWEADAPTRAVLGILREIDLLTKHIQASAQSRLAGAGLLAIPSEAVFPAGQGPQSTSNVDPDDEDLTPPEDNFVETLIDAMTTPLTDRGSAAAVVPLVVKVPGDLVDKMKHLTFATPFDAQSLDLLNNAIRRLALGLDLPPEILTGTSGMNHWGAWQVAEEAITLHIEPLSETVAHALTVGFLRPALIAEGYDPDEALVWYDTTALLTRADKSKSALEAYDRNELSSTALLREMGLSVEDLPSDEERRERILLSVAKSLPSAAPAILADLGYLSSATAEMIPSEETALEIDTPALPAPAEPRALPERASDASPTVVSAALAASCDMMVRRALERAGARLRSAAGKRTPGGAASIQCDDPAILHTSLEATAYADLGTLLDGAWSLVPEIADRYGADPALLEDTLDTYTRALIATQQEHRYGRLALALGSA